MARSNRRIHQLAAVTGLSTVEVLQRLRAHGVPALDEHDLIPKEQQEIALRIFGIDPITGRLLPKKITDLSQPPPSTMLQEPLEIRAEAAAAPPALERPPKGRKPAKAERQPKREIVGHRAEVMAYLTAKDIERIHWSLVREFEKSRDPIDPPGVRSDDLLESAAFRVHTALGGELKYPTIAMAAAAYMHALISNHAFHNGNKRTALVATLVFLDLNDYLLEIEEDPLFDYLVKIAAHEVAVGTGEESRADAEMLAVSRWISRHSRPIIREEHPLKFHQLREILNAYECTFEHPQKGNRINIKCGENRVQIYYRSEGTDVELNTIRKIRKELALTEDDGYDSTIFYNREQRIPEFIHRYRRTLQRLAKV